MRGRKLRPRTVPGIWNMAWFIFATTYYISWTYSTNSFCLIFTNWFLEGFPGHGAGSVWCPQMYGALFTVFDSQSNAITGIMVQSNGSENSPDFLNHYLLCILQLSIMVLVARRMSLKADETFWLAQWVSSEIKNGIETQGIMLEYMATLYSKGKKVIF